MAKIEELKECINKLESGDYTSYFYLPDFDKPSGGMGLVYDHVRVMNELGFKASIVHTKSKFKPEWLGKRAAGVPVVYLEDGKLEVKLNDFFFIPEGFPNIIENLSKQGAPCKKIVFCQNWFYVLNALPPGKYWDSFGAIDCLSVSEMQTNYLKAIMPFLRIKNVVGSFDETLFTPPENMASKKPIICFKNSRDGIKGYNVIKTFISLYPQLRFVSFKEIAGMTNEDYAIALKEAAFYLHLDEISSWGTAPIEAFMCKTLVAGWDGVGGREYMNKDNCWLAPNGDIFSLAVSIGNMIEAWLLDDVTKKTWKAMEAATMMYSNEAERDSILKAHNEYREERIAEISIAVEKNEKEEKGKE